MVEWFGAGDYELARQVLQRGVAAVYLIAFLSTAAQFPALLGERGLLPVARALRPHGGRRPLSVFRWHYSDRLLRVVAAGGAAISALLVAGLPQFGPPWLPLVLFLALWGAYLSVVNIGQTFYGFGWETLLLEAGFIVAFLGSNEVAPPVTVLWFIRWLVFRLEFGAGMIKMRGDRSWRDLTALYYHHETQPMPNPLSRWAHLLPKPVHRFEVLGNHLAQLVVPFLLFAPQPVASVAAAVVIVTQLWLVATGNFAWLNVLTIVLAFAAIDDGTVHALLPAWPANGAPATAAAPLWFVVVVLAATALLVALSWWPLRNLFSRRQLMNASFNRWHLVNAYGAFGSVTTRRREIEIEGTLAEVPSDAASWLAYGFHGKPGDPARIPRQFAPYHLRLDWLMWFLALGMRDSGWFRMLLQRLLEADRATLRLLRVDPFDGERPRWVRARVFHYRFATRAERRRTGLWWMREEEGLLVAPLGLERNGGWLEADRDEN
ncbi:lipase maturation factor family protein [Herbiconiux daphne]|uniref:Lipase maturation factor family protein n=1 Tax=Herbiconiux daphne TaxID=2970914 RepID=A0ABT2H5N7_9MICO|nr:lipase maturation factor family protein [Herbiconiux daphne]MCS5735238.1 lipase maturation factor family protein [Herbiconiux daphne]